MFDFHIDLVMQQSDWQSSSICWKVSSPLKGVSLLWFSQFFRLRVCVEALVIRFAAIGTRCKNNNFAAQCVFFSYYTHTHTQKCMRSQCEYTRLIAEQKFDKWLLISVVVCQFISLCKYCIWKNNYVNTKQIDAYNCKLHTYVGIYKGPLNSVFDFSIFRSRKCDCVGSGRSLLQRCTGGECKKIAVIKIYIYVH